MITFTSGDVSLTAVEIWFAGGDLDITDGSIDGADPFTVAIGGVSTTQPSVLDTMGPNVLRALDDEPRGVYVTYGITGIGDTISFTGGPGSSFRVRSMQVEAASVPERTTLGLLAIGLIGIGVARGCRVDGRA